MTLGHPRKPGVTSREKMSSYVADALIPRSTQHNSPPSRICHSLPKPPADCEKKDHTWQDDSNLLDLWLCFLVDFLASSEGDPKLSKVYTKHWGVQVSQNLPTRTFNLLLARFVPEGSPHLTKKWLMSWVKVLGVKREMAGKHSSRIL